MNWGIMEWSALIGLGITILGSGLASYLGVVKSNIDTRKDIDNGFEKLREFETNTQTEIKEIKQRLGNKAIKIEELEKMLYEYLKKHEAESLYCKKETMQPIVDNLQQNQSLIYDDLKEFRKEFKESINTVVASLNKHIDSDMQFQKELLQEFRKISESRA